MHTGFNSLWCSSTRYWIQTTSCRQAVKLRYVHGMTQCYDWISRHQIIYLRSVFFRDNIYEYRWRRQGIFSARLVLINVFPIRGRITFCPKQSRAVHSILIYSSKRLIGKRQIRSNWEWSLFSINPLFRWFLSQYQEPPVVAHEHLFSPWMEGLYMNKHKKSVNSRSNKIFLQYTVLKKYSYNNTIQYSVLLYSVILTVS